MTHPPATAPTSMQDLAAEILLDVRDGARRIIGIVGAPGSGKSTFAAQLAAIFPPGRCVVLPMDGFHLARAVIDGTELARRRGALDTFDGWGFLALMRRLHDRSEPVVYAPEFRRGLEEPIAGAIAVPREAQILLVEGNYLLVDEGPWRHIRACLSAAWYLETPRQVRLAQLIERHVRYGMSQREAEEWALGPDEVNAAVVESTRARADRILAWDPATRPPHGALAGLSGSAGAESRNAPREADPGRRG